MTFDSYAVAVNLSLVNGVSRGLATIITDLGLFNKGVAGAKSNLTEFHDQMAKLKSLGVIGGGVAALGFGGLDLLKGPYEEAKKYMQAKTDFENLNLSALDNAEAYAQAAAMSHKILGTNLADNIKQINDLHTAFGDLHHALRSSDDYAKYVFAAKVANGGNEVNGLANDSVKALEQRGGKVINDDATFKEELKRQSQVYFGSKGKVGGKDFFAASQTGGMAYTLYDKDYLYGEFAAFMQAKSGSTAGTAGMTAFSSLIGGHMDNKAKGFLADLGMLQVGVSKAQVALVNDAVGSLAMPDKEKAKLMKAMMPITGGLKDQYLDIAAHRPDVLINDYLVPAIRKKYGMTLTDEEVGMLVTKNFNRGTSKDLGELIVNHLKFVKDANIFANAKDYGGAYDSYLKSPEGAETAAAESWKNLSTMIGVTFIPTITAGLGSLAHGLDGLSQWTEQHPNLTKDLTYGFIALGSAMAIGGSITLATSAFKGLGLALEFAEIGGVAGIGKIGSGFGLVGDGIGIVGKAITAFGLVYAAWQAGQAVGNVINNHLSDDQKNGIGHVLSEAMAIAGSKDDEDGLRRVDPHSGALKFIDGVRGFKKHTDDIDKTIFAYRDKALSLIGIGPAKTLPAPPLPPINRYAAPPPAFPTHQGPDLSPRNKSDGDANTALHLTVNNYIDGKDVASYMIGSTTQGTTGINSTAFRLSPAMGPLGLMP